MKLVQGDVTRLSEAEVGSGFRLVLDTGTFHDFDTEQQRGMARSIDALATGDATVLLLCWPRRIRPLIRGVSREEIRAAFAGWKITDVEPSLFKLPRPLEWVLRPDEHWYRLRRARTGRRLTTVAQDGPLRAPPNSNVRGQRHG
jgi:hypothetical protein